MYDPVSVPELHVLVWLTQELPNGTDALWKAVVLSPSLIDPPQGRVHDQPDPDPDMLVIAITAPAVTVKVPVKIPPPLAFGRTPIKQVASWASVNPVQPSPISKNSKLARFDKLAGVKGAVVVSPLFRTMKVTADP